MRNTGEYVLAGEHREKVSKRFVFLTNQNIDGKITYKESKRELGTKGPFSASRLDAIDL